MKPTPLTEIETGIDLDSISLSDNEISNLSEGVYIEIDNIPMEMTTHCDEIPESLYRELVAFAEDHERKHKE